MPNLKLTQAAVERLRAPATGRVEYWDSQLPGFGLRIGAALVGREARKTWQVMYRVKGKLIRETLGTLSTVPKVDVARDLARASMQKAQKGINPVEERQRVKAEEQRQSEAQEARRRDTLAAILDRYVAEYGAKRWRPDTLKEISRSFATDIKPALGSRPIGELARRDVRELLDAIVARGRAPHAHHCLAYLRPALAWAVEREIIAANPADDIPDPDPRKREARTRDRYLDDDEIRLFWLACDKIGWPFGPLFQLLLLTGQRRDELAAARRPEFDFDKALWTLPRERTKNDKAHLVHLSPLALDILGTLHAIGNGGGFMFTTMGDSPVSGFGRARERLVAAMRDLRRGDLGSDSEPLIAIDHFTLHDLRRTTATGMAQLGIAQHVVEKVLNHTGGKISGVAATYNRFEYLDERRAALETWSRRVATLAGKAPANVVQLAAKR
jgi:integrase